ncbi:DNA end-binding protein Ku [Amycolatopsis tolypomycina]|uniref:Non-homologous end joining protein Ku n=1 Tax=Amycolatopsis tolypomycina TaxID=208445 RepID=A0A1H4Q1J1_9PSEU|nr:Ku protein [Amycolatopsis tolypomycina]SEC13390.1 DNA end-binding protein Ku [Amycolatopsis tolypomycina]
MRAVWTGTIGFGSYAIPVKAYSATEEREIPLHQVHEPDGGRIRVKRVCEVDGAEVPPEEMIRGYPVPGGDVVLLSDHELASLPMPGRTIAIRCFAPVSDVDPLWFAKSYYLEPEPAGTKPYVLFSEALQQSGRLALVTVALRRRETLGALRVRDQVIILETMRWPDEVRTPDFPFQHADVDIRPGELRRAANLVEELTGEFDPGRYPDRYREAFHALVQAKIDGAEVVQPTAAEQAEGVTRLLAALQESAADAEDARNAAVTKAKAAAARAAKARTTAKRAATRTRSKTS